MPCLDGGTAGVRRGESLQPVGPPAEPAPGEVGHELAEARAGIEPGMRRRHRVDHRRPAAEGLRLEADLTQLLAVLLDRVELLVRELEREWK